MADVVYDAVVVGAGIEGSSTAYHLAKAGKRTILLEQFPIPHGRGSSHGHSRIIRYAYDKDFYVPQMLDAYQQWFDLEKEAGTQLYIKTSIVVFGEKGTSAVADLVNALSKHGVAHQLLTAAQLAERFPQFSAYTDDTYDIMIDEMGGVLLADKCLASYLKLFQQQGGVIKASEKVTSIQPGNHVTIVTDKAVYKTKNVVLAAGPWCQKLTSTLGLNLPLRPERVPVYYWRVKSDGSHDADKFPTLIHKSSNIHVGGLPAVEYPGHVKVYYNGGTPTDPDVRDYVDDSEIVPKVCEYVQRHLPGLDGSKPSIIETCIYTMTPDKNPILDRHPAHPNIIIAAGLSGHGFKLAPVVGQILTALVCGAPAPYDLTPFKIARFSSV